ncbi:MAG: tRNA pseudouridine(13) synthase TruD, partial [Candidatus Methanomethylicus sp.]|nr:tRNA pseudouridine(13) synthase TruD [Candidatus Methanomethylicus sp.]
MSYLKTRSPLEQSLGMSFYSTHKKPLGGMLRQVPEDFLVEEVTPEGSVAHLDLKLDRGSGRYTLLVMRKRSRDQLSTISMVSKLLNARVTFAGIKDRRAVTCQLLSADRPLTEADLPKTLR